MLLLIRKLFMQGIKVAMASNTNNNSGTWASRKYVLALLIFAAATLMCALPPTLAVFVFHKDPIIVLTGSEWVTVMTMIGAFYFGANVAQKKLVNSSGDIATGGSNSGSPSSPLSSDPGITTPVPDTESKK